MGDAHARVRLRNLIPRRIFRQRTVAKDNSNLADFWEPESLALRPSLLYSRRLARSTRGNKMLRLIAFAAFALALATSAQALSPPPLQQSDGIR